MERKHNSKEEYSQRAPRKRQQGLRQALLEAKAENQELATEIAALKEQFASKKLSWEQEKNKLLDERDSLVSTLLMTRNDLDSLVKTVESSRESQKQSDAQCKMMEKKMAEKETEVRSLQCSLRFHMMEREKIENSLKAERSQAEERKVSFDKTLIELNAEWESRWFVKEEEVTATLNALQDREKKASQVIQEKDNLITSVREKMMALVEENLANMKAKDMVIHQSETIWQAKHKALEDHLRCELAAKEESFKETLELQKRHSTEQDWLAKEEKRLRKEQDWLAKEDQWHSKEQDWPAKEGEWLRKEQDWLAKENQWHSKEQDWLAKEDQWHSKEQDWLAKEGEWHSKEHNWLAKEDEWLRKEQNWLAKEDEWHNKEHNWLAKEEEWLHKGQDWLAKEEARLTKESKMDEEMKLLIRQNIEIQELALKTDKQKAKMRKEEKKAKKETEKRLKKERKQEEEREKKEKEENEKKEKERLKREKKENEEREKKEKKERKKREKKEIKE